jgi:hypothetical protein
MEIFTRTHNDSIMGTTKPEIKLLVVVTYTIILKFTTISTLTNISIIFSIKITNRKS